MKKKIIHWTSIQQLTICGVMSLNGLRSTGHKQGRSAATYANDETNHIIWFLSVCHLNIDIFLYWYEGSQIRDRYLDWSSYNTQAVIGQVNIGCQTLTQWMIYVESVSQCHDYHTFLKKSHFFIIFIVNFKWFEVHKKLKSD